MRDVLAWGGLLLAFGAAIWGKLILALAEGYLAEVHKEVHTRLGESSGPLSGFSGPERRVRKKLASGLLFGELHPALAADDKMKLLQSRWRLAAGLIVAGFALTIFAFSLGRS